MPVALPFSEGIGIHTLSRNAFAGPFLRRMATFDSESRRNEA
jgi:hypothetical protein